MVPELIDGEPDISIVVQSTDITMDLSETIDEII